MKGAGQKCPKPPPPPKPNLKNKDFVKWQIAESCKREDNIVSTEWHEKLQRTEPFVPVYNNAPLNMNYLLSGEYGRIWQKERDEWYSQVFVLKSKEKDMDDRKKKIRKEMREAKKAAEVNIRERKERRAKELEAKAKAEAERLEKLRVKVHKNVSKKPQKKKKESTRKGEQAPASDAAEEDNKGGSDGCPKGWTPVELTLQCECSDHAKDAQPEEKKDDEENAANQKSNDGSVTVCEDYLRQLIDVQEAKDKETQSGESPCKHHQTPRTEGETPGVQ